MLRNTLTDTPASAPEENRSNPSHLFTDLAALAESARETWRAATYDTRLRRLLADFHVPAQVQEGVIQNGTAVSFFRERTGTRNVSSRCGPAIVIGFQEAQQRYVLEYGSNTVLADRSFVKRWLPDLDPELDFGDDQLLDLVASR